MKSLALFLGFALLIILVILAFSVIDFFWPDVNAGEIAKIEKGVLVITKTTELARVSNVPRELWNKPDLAWKLCNGELKEALVDSLLKDRENRFYLSFPFSIIEEINLRKNISFVSGVWQIQNTTPKVSKVSNFGFTLFSIVFPIGIVFTVCFFNRLDEVKTWKLILFLVVILVCGYFGYFKPIWYFVFAFVTAVSGSLASKQKSVPMYVISLLAIFILAAVFPGYTGYNPKNSLGFVLFLATTEIFCLFMANYFAKFWKKYRQKYLRKFEIVL